MIGIDKCKRERGVERDREITRIARIRPNLAVKVMFEEEGFKTGL